MKITELPQQPAAFFFHFRLTVRTVDRHYAALGGSGKRDLDLVHVGVVIGRRSPDAEFVAKALFEHRLGRVIEDVFIQKDERSGDAWIAEAKILVIQRQSGHTKKNSERESRHRNIDVGQEGPVDN